MKCRNWLHVIVVCALLLPGPAAVKLRADPGVLYVKPGAGGSCTSWDRACELQTALGVAVAPLHEYADRLGHALEAGGGKGAARQRLDQQKGGQGYGKEHGHRYEQTAGDVPGHDPCGSMTTSFQNSWAGGALGYRLTHGCRSGCQPTYVSGRIGTCSATIRSAWA